MLLTHTHSLLPRDREDDPKLSLGEESVHVYDLEQESMDDPQSNGTPDPTPHLVGGACEGTSQITCNSSPMVREKLTGNSATFQAELSFYYGLCEL